MLSIGDIFEVEYGHSQVFIRAILTWDYDGSVLNVIILLCGRYCNFYLQNNIVMCLYDLLLEWLQFLHCLHHIIHDILIVHA